MTKKAIIFLAISFVVGFAASACASMSMSSSGTWRYKLTVAVETPEGVKTGSAVREVRASGNTKIFPEQAPVSFKVTGEAVVVDLGARGQVFALLKTYKHGIDGAHYIVPDAFPNPDMDMTGWGGYYSRLEAGPIELKQSLYPMFVHFRDAADPKTVENLLEYERCSDERGVSRGTVCLKNDRFGEAFGEGVTLKSVTIEMTKEPVTTGGVERYLSWLPEYENMMFDGQRYNTANSKYPFANSLAAGAFKAGDYK